MTKAERIANWNKNFCEWRGLDENGTGYVVLGNTYEIKDELKKHGARYSQDLGWVLPHEVAEYPSFKITLENIAIIKEDGKYIPKSNMKEIIDEKKKALTPKVESNSKYVGEVGKQYEGAVVCTKVYQFAGLYGTTNVYTFKEIDTDNVLVWMTSKYFDFTDEPIWLRGTVKEHTEYRDIKQTKLTRCTVKFI